MMLISVVTFQLTPMVSSVVTRRHSLLFGVDVQDYSFHEIHSDMSRLTAENT